MQHVVQDYWRYWLVLHTILVNVAIMTRYQEQQYQVISIFKHTQEGTCTVIENEDPKMAVTIIILRK